MVLTPHEEFKVFCISGKIYIKNFERCLVDIKKNKCRVDEEAKDVHFASKIGPCSRDWAWAFAVKSGPMGQAQPDWGGAQQKCLATILNSDGS